MLRLYEEKFLGSEITDFDSAGGVLASNVVATVGEVGVHQGFLSLVLIQSVDRKQQWKNLWRVVQDCKVHWMIE